jgi:aminoglycoside phosphotransferase (APT) family kinase protein
VRGALLAEFHVATERLALEQRPSWTTRLGALEASRLPALLRPYARRLPQERKRLLRELDATRVALAELGAASRPLRLVHGDFARWNLRYRHGRLTGLLDWELAHLDDPLADFAWTWRGRYDDVVHGYRQVTPLDDRELALIEPTWRAWLLDEAAWILGNTPVSALPELAWLIAMLDREPEPL